MNELYKKGVKVLLVEKIMSLSKKYDNYGVYVSCVDNPETKPLSIFNPVCDFYKGDNVVIYSFNNKKPLLLSSFKDKIKDSPYLEGDVEDGIVYEEFSNILVRDDIKAIILLWDDLT